MSGLEQVRDERHRKAERHVVYDSEAGNHRRDPACEGGEISVRISCDCALTSKSFHVFKRYCLGLRPFSRRGSGCLLALGPSSRGWRLAAD
ncbi:MAG: hypothetical protein SGPRY_008800 [Prymnesium sp.]